MDEKLYDQFKIDYFILFNKIINEHNNNKENKEHQLETYKPHNYKELEDEINKRRAILEKWNNKDEEEEEKKNEEKEEKKKEEEEEENEEKEEKTPEIKIATPAETTAKLKQNLVTMMTDLNYYGRVVVKQPIFKTLTEKLMHDMVNDPDVLDIARRQWGISKLFEGDEEEAKTYQQKVITNYANYYNMWRTEVPKARNINNNIPTALEIASLYTNNMKILNLMDDKYKDLNYLTKMGSRGLLINKNNDIIELINKKYSDIKAKLDDVGIIEKAGVKKDDPIQTREINRSPHTLCAIIVEKDNYCYFKAGNDWYIYKNFENKNLIMKKIMYDPSLLTKNDIVNSANLILFYRYNDPYTFTYPLKYVEKNGQKIVHPLSQLGIMLKWIKKYVKRDGSEIKDHVKDDWENNIDDGKGQSINLNEIKIKLFDKTKYNIMSDNYLYYIHNNNNKGIKITIINFRSKTTDNNSVKNVIMEALAEYATII